MIIRHLLVWPTIWLGNIVLADVVLDEEILPPDFERSIVLQKALGFSFNCSLQSCWCYHFDAEHTSPHPL